MASEASRAWLSDAASSPRPFTLIAHAPACPGGPLAPACAPLRVLAPVAAASLNTLSPDICMAASLSSFAAPLPMGPSLTVPRKATHSSPCPDATPQGSPRHGSFFSYIRSFRVWGYRYRGHSSLHNRVRGNETNQASV